jgi:hypothetical protein
MDSQAAVTEDLALQLNSQLTSKGSRTKLASVIAKNAPWNSMIGTVSLGSFGIGIDR